MMIADTKYADHISYSVFGVQRETDSIFRLFVYGGSMEKIGNILIYDKAQQFQDLADYQKEHYPDNPITIPKELPIKHVLPDFIDYDPEIEKEMRQRPHKVRRSKGW